MDFITLRSTDPESRLRTKDCDSLGDTENDGMKLGSLQIPVSCCGWGSFSLPELGGRPLPCLSEGHRCLAKATSQGTEATRFLPILELRLGRAVALSGWSPVPVLASVPWLSPSSEVLSVTEEYLTAHSLSHELRGLVPLNLLFRKSWKAATEQRLRD